MRVIRGKANTTDKKLWNSLHSKTRTAEAVCSSCCKKNFKFIKRIIFTVFSAFILPGSANHLTVVMDKCGHSLRHYLLTVMPRAEMCGCVWKWLTDFSNSFVCVLHTVQVTHEKARCPQGELHQINPVCIKFLIFACLTQSWDVCRSYQNVKKCHCIVMTAVCSVTLSLVINTASSRCFPR